MAYQNWNNIISYIKSKLGVPVNQLELSDVEIQSYLQEHMIPEFSQYSPDKKWVYLPSASGSNITKNQYTYTFDIEENITCVESVYYATDAQSTIIQSLQGYFLDPRDTSMSNSFIDMIDFLNVYQTFEFLPPKRIQFSRKVSDIGAIVELNIEHQKLDTIQPDLYQKIFKPMAHKHVLDLVIATRSKFTELSSPFGTMNLNVDRLETQRDRLSDKLEEDLNLIPTRTLIAWM